MKEKDIREMIDQAVEFQRKGECDKGLDLLREAEEKLKLFDKNISEPLKGLIRHYQGRILQAMGKYDAAEEKLQEAVEIRKEDPIGHAYSLFQLYICRNYAEQMVSPIMIGRTKRALWELANSSNDPKQIGDAFQNLAYIEFTEKVVNKATWFYHVAEVFRGIANDQRGLAVTQARLGECYKAAGSVEKAEEYGKKALEYFEKVGDVERIQQVRKNVFG